jgi:peptidoglycan/xylan/chitin deacetylase (PgdA/CDA1 family)
MPPQLPDPTAPNRRPRHAAGPDRRPVLGATFAARQDGRHRRPERSGHGFAGAEAELSGHWSAQQTGSHQAAQRRGGRHAARNDLAITVRPLPVVRDAAGAVREWAVYPGDKPPVMGIHRAPGTLPIESWLLVGRSRQQALLATLVAAGLALVMIPIERHAAVDPVTAADRSIVGTGAGGGAKTRPPAATTKPAHQPAPGTPAKGGTPPAPNRPAGSAHPSAPPAIAVPPGTGPAQSLRVTGSNTVALTFDDGPDPVQTPKILALLAKYHVKATFCLVGKNVAKHPEIVRQIVDAGHTLCNHTWSHSLTIGAATPAQIDADLTRTNAAIRAAVPDAEIPFFRAPGGNFTDRLVSTAYAQGMTSLHWQVDPRDWDHSTDADDTTHIDRVVADVQKSVRPGSIILSHDFNQPDTVAAYEKLLPWITETYRTGIAVPPALPAVPDSADPESADPESVDPESVDPESVPSSAPASPPPASEPSAYRLGQADR